MYGSLSEVAHFSKPRVAELLHVVESGDLIGPSLIPIFNDLCFACLDMSCFISLYFLSWVAEKLPIWYPGYDNSKERRLVAAGIALALNTGVMKMAESPDKSVNCAPSSTFPA